VATVRSPDELLDRIREIGSPYHERAYLFVLAALEFCQLRRIKRGHISGQELSLGCRDYALAQFGLTAGAVLEYWGITSTRDIGHIVFALVDLGLLMKQDADSIDDFEAVYDFEEEFDESYPWLDLRHAVKEI